MCFLFHILYGKPLSLCIHTLFRMTIYAITSVVDKFPAKVSKPKKIEEMELQTLELSARVT